MKKIQFIILDERTIKRYNLEEKHIVISITSPSSNHPELPKSSFRVALLQLKFSDIDRKICHPKARLFTQGQAKAIWNFFQNYKSKIDTVICQCEVGVCRSPAVAAALCKLIGQDDNRFFKCYVPNRFVYRLILEEGMK